MKKTDTMAVEPLNLSDEGRPMSVVIRERVAASKKRYYANDNISDFIQPGDMDKLLDEVESKMKGVLDSMVIDTEHDHNTHNTARQLPKKVCRKM